MVITFLIIWCIVPTVTMGVWGDNFGKISGFIIMYILGAYIRLYGLNIIIKKVSARVCLAVSCVALAAFVFFMDMLSVITGNDIFMSRVKFFIGESSLFCVLIAVSIFVVFKEKNYYNHWVNYIAQSVFGIYLFHNSGVFLALFFQKLYPNKDFIDSEWFLAHLLLKVIGIFILGVFVDKIRKLLFKRTLEDRIDRWLDKKEELKANG